MRAGWGQLIDFHGGMHLLLFASLSAFSSQFVYK